MADLRELAKKLLTIGPHKIVPTSRRVRIVFNGTYIVDTTSARHVWEHEYFPQFYVPLADLKKGIWSKQADIEDESGADGAMIMQIKVSGTEGREDRKTDRVIGFYGSPAADRLTGLVRCEFRSMDQWLEEDLPVYGHPKDPFKRVDILPSTRSLVIKLGPHTLASSNSAMHLLETGLPTRYYLPISSVSDQSVLRPSKTMTLCPYKGQAEYYDVVLGGEVYRDLVWYYTYPTLECASIARMICFYNEKVDIWLDGVKQERPKTHF